MPNVFFFMQKGLHVGIKPSFADHVNPHKQNQTIFTKICFPDSISIYSTEESATQKQEFEKKRLANATGPARK